MDTNLDSDRAPIDWMQMGFYAAAVAFNLCLIAQLFTVGVAYFQNPAWWNIHVWFVRGYSGLSLILLGWVFVTTFPSKIQRLVVSLPLLLGLQFVSIHLKSPLNLAVLHPLIGFVLFYISSSLVHSVWRTLSPSDRQNGLV
ncbi:DUF6220 domain-containing protein [Tumidithrix elongata RA019]|uniref:DUF6220 domain-containing protein n=1 Tax=Tumidithrix elongata BACA0141 TaxID=2716417 RepID=A0AAW9Q2K5_9CYAN|nr:DUF6220 domain-containing protein [Tumidithrix elongata RA019]